MPTRTALVLLTLLASGSALRAQTAKPSESLSGPKVEEKARTPSLVRATLDGKLDRITQSVEEAAVAILPLSDEERAKVNEVIVQRAATVDRVVRENIPLLLRIQGIREEGITQDRQSAVRELDRALPELRDREGFRSALRGAMSSEHAAMFDTIVNEYSRAAVADATSTARAEGRKGNPFAMSVGESLRNVGLEIQQSFDRIVTDAASRLDHALKTLEPTAEQEGKIRTLASEYAQKSLAEKSPSLRARFVREFSRLLSHEQRLKLAHEYFNRPAHGAQETPNSPDKK